MQTSINPEPNYSTVSDELDRLEVPAGKIGLIDARQAMDLLVRLDGAYDRIQELNAGSQSRQTAETQFRSIVTRLDKEAPRFLRDLGGARVLEEARAKRKPPPERSWWYLDVALAARRQAAMQRALRTVMIVLAVLAVLSVVYNRFFAPDPVLNAIFRHEQAARDFMISGDLPAAEQEVQAALALNPQEPSNVILMGVIQEGLGNQSAAQQAYAQGQDLLNNREDFLVTRGQSYFYMNAFEKSLADGQAVVDLNPDSALGHLLSAQANEALGRSHQALTDYNLAFDAADRTNQAQLAAIIRTRMAMLMQVMNANIEPSELPTEAP